MAITLDKQSDDNGGQYCDCFFKTRIIAVLSE